MLGRLVKRGKKKLPCVLIDVNTQIDFLNPDGACPALNREVLVPALRNVVAWAKRNQVAVVSSIDCHRQGELHNAHVPQHCVDGTSGQDKVDFTLFGTYVRVEGDNTLAVPIDLFRKHQQVIFRKRTEDFFMNPKADRFVTQLPAAEYVIAGLELEHSIKAIALGLIARSKRVSLVADACGFFDESKADLALRLLSAKGVEIISVEQLMSRKLPRHIRYPRAAGEPISMRNGLFGCTLKVAGHNGNGHQQRAASGNGRVNGQSLPPA